MSNNYKIQMRLLFKPVSIYAKGILIINTRCCKSLAFVVLTALALWGCQPEASVDNIPNPNIIFILSDDLNWGDLGCFGQEKIKTPNIDRIAHEGMKFINAYAGNSVCAPSRSALMEGKHPGHARVRGNMINGFRESLRDGDSTVAMVLKQAGYKTGLFGKWGLGLYNQPGIPNNMGFDEFFGFLNQRHAHCFYPEFLYHNQERICFPENGEFNKVENYRRECPYDENGKCLPWGIKEPSEAKYSFDLYCERSLEFVRKNKSDPFFLYLAYTIPHGAIVVPELGEHTDKDWTVRRKEYAAMVSRMDNEVGNLLNLLEELDLDENTIIFFAADNGSLSTGDLADFFDSNSPTRGNKGDSYNGAFHVPAMVRWPGYIKPNQVSDHIWAFWDFLPTVAEITGIEPPSDIDGISILPVLLGKGEQKKHEYLYWEYKQNQAVRYGEWFAHKLSGEPVELYDLASDPQQVNDLSARFPDIVEKIEEIMLKAHIPSNVWPSPGETKEEFSRRLTDNNIPERPENVALF